MADKTLRFVSHVFEINENTIPYTSLATH